MSIMPIFVSAFLPIYSFWVSSVGIMAQLEVKDQYIFDIVFTHIYHNIIGYHDLI